ncbi:MAG TPA: tetratricopeptide repeat protein [Cyclobacteriaceae bacterium]|nr:tetratricopeptide repeat protein [Cyclobacteriaceae bacterium]
MANSNYNIYINTLIIRTLCLCIGFLTFLSFQVLSKNQADIQLAHEYLLKGEKRKALELYRELAKNDTNLPYIQNNYLNALLDLSETDEALNFLKKLIKKNPDNLFYKIDVGVVYLRTGDAVRADKHFRDLIQENKAGVSQIKLMSDYFASRSLGEYAVLALSEARTFLGNPYLFCLELAMLYRIQGQKDKMVQEYLNYVTQASANIQFAKNLMQAILTKPDELETLEKILYERVQKNPDVEAYADLLIWVTMQQKNFHAAFIQARAYDRRYKKMGEKSIEVAKVAIDNEDFDNAIKSYQYVVKEYPGGPYFLQAQLGLMRTREARVRNMYPVSKDSVQSLIVDYKKFISAYPDNTNSLEAKRNEAILYATYLNEIDKAIATLEELIANPRTSLQLKSKAKLDLGDIYLLKGEPWESTLLYSQVEKSLQENPVGYEAKLKNAKLSYYKGNFQLAQEHLDILKEATTREIANDAMELSMRIKENIAFDSTGAALKAYAVIELLLYQNKTEQALIAIQSLKQGTSTGSDSATNRLSFSNHTILDDVYWLEANIRMQRGEFNESITLLQRILDEFPEDILVDDAYFLQGEIYERQLQNKDKAMEVYREFLNKFPGSVFAAEARKRYRVLRGDFKDEKLPQS